MLREDLYYRLNVFSIALPPLRERARDIAGLVAHFITKHGHATRGTRLSDAVLERLQRYAWPGNVRELENMVERALIVSGGGVLDTQHFLLPAVVEPGVRKASTPGGQAMAMVPLTQAVEEPELRLIDEALTRADGNKARAAALLDISERTLWYKLKRGRPDQVAD